MKRLSVFLCLVIAFTLLAGCRNPVNIHRPNDYNQFGFSFSGDFESFWSAMNLYYSFWDVEPVRYWDSVYVTYKPMFDSLQNRYNRGERFDTLRTEGYNFYREFLAPLKDGHLLVLFNNPTSAIPAIAPNEDRVAARFASLTADDNPRRAFASTWTGKPFTGNTDYPNYDFWEGTMQNYVKEARTRFPNPNDLTADTSPDSFRIATGRIPLSNPSDFILYLYFSEFDLARRVQTNRDVSAIMAQYLNDIPQPNLKGVIIDMRGNRGGANSDIDYVLNRLIQEPLHFAYTRNKSGVNRLDFTPWIPYIISPHPVKAERVQNNIPVVALVNDYSISSGELLPMAVSRMPKGYLIGTQTYGATGPRFGNNSPAVLNAGSFTNNSGYTLWNQVVMAGFQTKDTNHTSYEGIGIPPNEEIAFRWDEFASPSTGFGHGRDRQLLAAIQHIDRLYIGPLP